MENIMKIKYYFSDVPNGLIRNALYCKSLI